MFVHLFSRSSSKNRKRDADGENNSIIRFHPKAASLISAAFLFIPPYAPFYQISYFDALSQQDGVNCQGQFIIPHYHYVRNRCAIPKPQLKKGDSMPIMTVTWIMILSLVVTYILLNIFGNKKMNQPDKRVEIERRHFSYGAHIPERRSGDDRRLSYN